MAIIVPMQVTATNESVPVQVEENAENLPAAIDLRIGYKGEKGDTGVGIASCVLNPDYTLTINLTDGTSYTTESIRGAQGEKGADGASGKDGKDGSDGISPAVSITEGTKQHTLSIIDATGTHSTVIYDGQDGQNGTNGTNGADGFSPTASVTKSGGVATITITDKNGTTTETVSDGLNGTNGTNGMNGQDGFSPSASVSKSGSTATISITDKNGTTTAQISDGTNGTNGQDGAAGQDGKSAYQYAVDGGYTGTEQEFTAKMAAEIPSKTSDLTNDSGFITGMTILSYGHSTWADFLEAYTAQKVVYCRASSNSNPASGSQTRLAFMAYVSNADNPTSVEFQYYRSVNQHSATQQGDQVYVYKLDKTAGWTVTVREAMSKIAVGSGLSLTYSNGVITISLA